MRDDGRALVDVGADSTQMVPVMMRIHDKLDRLVWNELVHFADHRKRPLLIQRRLDNDRMVAELDGQAVVGASCDQPQAIAQLL